MALRKRKEAKQTKGKRQMKLGRKADLEEAAKSGLQGKSSARRDSAGSWTKFGQGKGCTQKCLVQAADNAW